MHLNLTLWGSYIFFYSAAILGRSHQNMQMIVTHNNQVDELHSFKMKHSYR